MTVDELNQFLKHKSRLDRKKERLCELYAERDCISSLRFDGMPRARSNESKVERIAAKIADLEGEISADRITLLKELSRLERYIQSVSDSLIRMIMIYRFEYGYTWKEVARNIDGYNAEPVALRVFFERYLKKINNPRPEIDTQ